MQSYSFLRYPFKKTPENDESMNRMNLRDGKWLDTTPKSNKFHSSHRKSSQKQVEDLWKESPPSPISKQMISSSKLFPDNSEYSVHLEEDLGGRPARSIMVSPNKYREFNKQKTPRENVIYYSRYNRHMPSSFKTRSNILNHISNENDADDVVPQDLHIQPDQLTAEQKNSVKYFHKYRETEKKWMNVVFVSVINGLLRILGQLMSLCIFLIRSIWVSARRIKFNMILIKSRQRIRVFINGRFYAQLRKNIKMMTGHVYSYGKILGSIAPTVVSKSMDYLNSVVLPLGFLPANMTLKPNSAAESKKRRRSKRISDSHVSGKELSSNILSRSYNNFRANIMERIMLIGTNLKNRSSMSWIFILACISVALVIAFYFAQFPSITSQFSPVQKQDEQYELLSSTELTRDEIEKSSKSTNRANSGWMSPIFWMAKETGKKVSVAHDNVRNNPDKTSTLENDKFEQRIRKLESMIKNLVASSKVANQAKMEEIGGSKEIMERLNTLEEIIKREGSSKQEQENQQQKDLFNYATGGLGARVIRMKGLTYAPDVSPQMSLVPPEIILTKVDVPGRCWKISLANQPMAQNSIFNVRRLPIVTVWLGGPVKLSKLGVRLHTNSQFNATNNIHFEVWASNFSQKTFETSSRKDRSHSLKDSRPAWWNEIFSGGFGSRVAQLTEALAVRISDYFGSDIMIGDGSSILTSIENILGKFPRKNYSRNSLHHNLLQIFSSTYHITYPNLKNNVYSNQNNNDNEASFKIAEISGEVDDSRSVLSFHESLVQETAVEFIQFRVVADRFQANMNIDSPSDLCLFGVEAWGIAIAESFR